MVCLLSSLPKYIYLLFQYTSFGAFSAPTYLDTDGAPGISLLSLPKEYLGINPGIPNGRNENNFLGMSIGKLQPPNHRRYGWAGYPLTR